MRVNQLATSSAKKDLPKLWLLAIIAASILALALKQFGVL
jgi:hypothetical protein